MFYTGTFESSDAPDPVRTQRQICSRRLCNRIQTLWNPARWPFVLAALLPCEKRRCLLISGYMFRTLIRFLYFGNWQVCWSFPNVGGGPWAHMGSSPSAGVNLSASGSGPWNWTPKSNRQASYTGCLRVDGNLSCQDCFILEYGAMIWRQWLEHMYGLPHNSWTRQPRCLAISLYPITAIGKPLC